MGGSERYVWGLSREQANEYDVHVFTTTRSLSRVGVSDEDGVTFHRFYSPVSVWNINPISLMLKPLLDSDTDIFHVHSHLYFTSNQAILARKIKSRKAVLQLHGGVGVPPYRTRASRLIAKILYDRTLGAFTIRNSDIVASVSRSDLHQVGEIFSIPESRLKYIPNAVDTEKFKPLPSRGDHTKTLMYIGDLEEWKGIRTLIRWVKKSSKLNNHKIRVRIIGEGSYFSVLKRLERELCADGHSIELEVLGPKPHDQIPTLLQNSDALILPSYWEGMPTVVLEAMAAGVPVISTPVGDIPNMIKNGETGFIIGHSLSSIQKAVNLVLHDESLASRIATNGRIKVKRAHSLSKVSRIVSDVYADIKSRC